MSEPETRVASHPKSFWLEHIEQWKKSGLSKADYCRRHGLSAGNFYNWCSSESKPVKRKSKPSSVSLNLVPVNLNGTDDSTVSFENLNGKFSFPANLTGDQITRWLGAIERLDV